MYTEKEFRVGEPLVVESESHEPPYSVVFEDDGSTGYFYALDTRRGEKSILDAWYIYNCGRVADSSEEHELRIEWSADGARAALVIDEFAHAMFDFATPRAMCAGNFPPPSSREPYVASHAWDEDAFHAAFPSIRSAWGWQQTRQGG